MPPQFCIGAAHVCSNSSASHSASKIRHQNKCHSCLGWVCLFSYLTGQGDILPSCFLTPMYYLEKKKKEKNPSFFLIRSQVSSLGPVTLMGPGEDQRVLQSGLQKAFQKPITKYNPRPKAQHPECESTSLLILLPTDLSALFEIFRGVADHVCVYQ